MDLELVWALARSWFGTTAALRPRICACRVDACMECARPLEGTDQLVQKTTDSITSRQHLLFSHAFTGWLRWYV